MNNPQLSGSRSRSRSGQGRYSPEKIIEQLYLVTLSAASPPTPKSKSLTDYVAKASDAKTLTAISCGRAQLQRFALNH